MSYLTPGPAVNTKVQLDYEPTASDLANGTAVTAATWTDLCPNQTFIVDDSNSIIEISAQGNALLGNSTAGNDEVASRIVVDSAGSAITKMIGGGWSPNISGTNTFSNVLGGSSLVALAGLSAGNHTVKVQVYSANAGTLYCRTSTTPNTESFSLRVLERKQSVSPPSSTPAPAVRVTNSGTLSSTSGVATALTFDTTRYDQGTSTPQHSTSTNTSRLVCQQAGVYHIVGNIGITGNTSDVRDLSIMLNGTTVLAYNRRTLQNLTTNPYWEVSTQYQLSVGDYVELVLSQGSGSTLTVQKNSNFSPEFMMARIDSGGQGFVPIPMVKTTNYTVLNTDAMVVAGANSLTFTLPAASTRAPGMPLVVKNDNFTGTTIARAGSDTIDGATSYSLVAAYASITLVGDGVSVWRVI